MLTEFQNPENPGIQPMHIRTRWRTFSQTFCTESFPIYFDFLDFKTSNRQMFISTTIMSILRLPNWKNGMLWLKSFSEYMKPIFDLDSSKGGQAKKEDLKRKYKN